MYESTSQTWGLEPTRAVLRDVHVLRAETGRGPVLAVGLLVGALGALSVSSVSGLQLAGLAIATILVVAIVIGYRWFLRWDVLTGLLILVILFIPIRRFVLPGNLPFQLEPYRLLIAFLGAAWGTSLLIDPRVQLRRSGLEAPVWLFLAAAMASVFFNFHHIATGALYIDPVTRVVTEGSLDSNVIKAFTFFLSFVFVFYFIGFYVFVVFVNLENLFEGDSV